MSETGRTGEDLVAKEYERQGYKILDRNYIFPKGKQMGELDLVCRKGNELAFVEVKLRRSNKFGTPFEAVSISKQRKLVKMTKLYMLVHKELEDCDYRIDVAAVTVDKEVKSVKILVNAIEDFD